MFYQRRWVNFEETCQVNSRNNTHLFLLLIKNLHFFVTVLASGEYLGSHKTRLLQPKTIVCKDIYLPSRSV